MAIGDYTKTTFVNGTTPAINAINLNNHEDKTDELDLQLADTLISIVYKVPW